MGVYIKGMEMPMNCGECLLAKLSPTGESLICNYMLSRVSWEERPFDCPLVPVPPHGDLIDRKALVNDKYATFTIEEEGLWGMYRDKGIWLSAVENAPTIIPAEEGE